jgi:hypothetical protein
MGRRLFMLGSGFSKAMSPKMPVIKELSQKIREEFGQLPCDPKVCSQFLDDPEGLLTYLYQGMPWKSPEETHTDRAAFISLSRSISDFIKMCEAEAFRANYPNEVEEFVQYLHRQSIKSGLRITVATFNYDTVVERIARYLRAIDTPDDIAYLRNFMYAPTEIADDGRNLLRYLRNQNQSSHKYIKSRLSTSLCCEIDEFDLEKPPSQEFQNKILDELNCIIQGEPIYTKDRFPSFRVSLDFEELLEGKQFQLANRILLDSAFTTSSLEPIDQINTADLYRMPLTHLAQRTTGLYSSKSHTTFRLIKLHGSINWFFTGSENFVGEQIYFIPVTSNSPMTDARQLGEVLEINSMDLVPLIVPPVSEKTSFYNNLLVRTLWTSFREALEEAEEIYCIGYSLPQTDFSLRLFLSAFAGENKSIFVVNSATGQDAESLLSNYKSTFKNCKINGDFLSVENPLAALMDYLQN